MQNLGISPSDLVQTLLYLALLVGLSIPLGSFLAKVFGAESHPLLKPLGWIERLVYRASGIDPTIEMNWKSYLRCLLLLNGLGLLVVFLLQLVQGHLPLNPQNLTAVPPLLALNTAVSFMTNTNWQAYSGEATLSYFTQMFGLTVQNFLSAATGMAVAVALARGLQRKEADRIGNFWVDLVRGTVYVLFPLSLVLAVVLIGQGVVQNFSPYVEATTLEGAKQVLPMGPAASQIAIKQLGTNGGGFFGVNSAHPFENPTPLSNFLQMLSILLLPAAMVYMFGRMVGRVREGWAIYGAMLLMLVVGIGVALYAESQPNSLLGGLPFLEGKDLRFGIGNSTLWGVATTAASNGSVNAMHDSFAPLTGLVALFNMLVGEVIFGGVGAGLYGMLMFVLLTVFLAGLMVGRTPEYLGKKIESFEVICAAVAVLAPSIAVLVFSAVAAVSSFGLASLTNAGPHGLSEILYAFASSANNNGSAFGGLNANTTFYNLATGAAMVIGRFAVIVPALAIAGSMAKKKKSPPSAGTFPTDSVLFTGLLVAVIVIVGALTFFPVLVLSPIVEHLLLGAGRSF